MNIKPTTIIGYFGLQTDTRQQSMVLRNLLKQYHRQGAGTRAMDFIINRAAQIPLKKHYFDRKPAKQQYDPSLRKVWLLYYLITK